jgi:hypothetical protein
MGEKVYEKTFTIVACAPEQIPTERENEQSLGRHLQGCRIGFDLGASELKASAVVDGANQVLQSEFPELAARISIQLPDEKTRRVGQSIAAASLLVIAG